MTAPQSTADPADTTRKNALNVTQVAAAALAAVTAALLGSQLGAAGTVIGAAGASVVTTVGTAVYHASLERSRERVRSLAQRTRSSPISRAGATTPYSFSAAQNPPIGDEPLPGGAGSGTPSGKPSRRLVTLRYGAAVVAALGAFLFAMIAITGFELASGNSIGGNGKGTTIARMVNTPNGPEASDPATPLVPSSSVPDSEDPGQDEQDSETTTTTTSTPWGDRAGTEPDTSETAEQPEPDTATPSQQQLVPGLPGVGN